MNTRQCMLLVTASGGRKRGCGGASPHNFEMGFYFADSCIDYRPI